MGQMTINNFLLTQTVPAMSQSQNHFFTGMAVFLFPLLFNAEKKNQTSTPL